jgi:hypothetical protein
MKTSMVSLSLSRLKFLCFSCASFKGYFRSFIAFEIHATSNAVFFLFLDFENLMLRICPVDRIVKMQRDD